MRVSALLRQPFLLDTKTKRKKLRTNITKNFQNISALRLELELLLAFKNMSTHQNNDLESFFPLRTLGDLRAFFSAQLTLKDPDLALLSIVSGALEHQWTQSKVQALTSSSSGDASPSLGTVSLSNQDSDNPCLLKINPALEWSTVEALKAKFESIIKGFCEVNLLQDALNGGNLRPMIKHVADIIWNTLSKSHYKDRPHLQSIYSYLTGNKLDCFGVAFAVVAACQLLSLENVHLALSEDHAWVVFGEDGTETAEVTWHGKGNEDKRGKPVDIDKAKNSWLYVAGQPVVCDRHMEVSALVSSINPAITANLDSIECGTMQQELLWLLHDMGYLKHYPMALGNLGDLEEISPSLGRPPCTKLFLDAINANKEVFHNHHVYPYTYLAGYYYRQKDYKKALECWSNAAEVIKIYRYSKDDEEIYKEFLEIANELIPHLVKSSSLDPKLYNLILKDPECFAFLLKFYDGICCWEEGSATPVLHIGWAKPMVSSCSKFDPQIRAKVAISEETPDHTRKQQTTSSNLEEGKLETLSPPSSTCVPDSEHEDQIINNNYVLKNNDNVSTSEVSNDSSSSNARSSSDNNSMITGETCDSSSKKLLTENTTCSNESELSNLVNQLSERCKENVLNLNYLLGRKSAKPFLVPDSLQAQALIRNPKRIKKKTAKKNEKLSGANKKINDFSDKNVEVKLESFKMKGLQGLLCAEKLNTSAIQLQLTAQSQTRKGFSAQSSGADSETAEGRPKRIRRE